VSAPCRPKKKKKQRTPAEMRAYRARNPELIEAQNHRRQAKIYGIPLAQYEELIPRLNGPCDICGNHETRIHNGRVSRLAIDHDHETGAFRGLACQRCNLALGYVADDTSLLQKMIDYLTRHSEFRNRE
jgi:hypothetical protein